MLICDRCKKPSENTYPYDGYVLPIEVVVRDSECENITDIRKIDLCEKCLKLIRGDIIKYMDSLINPATPEAAPEPPAEQPPPPGTPSTLLPR